MYNENSKSELNHDSNVTTEIVNSLNATKG